MLLECLGPFYGISLSDRSHDGALFFEAIEMDLQAILEIGRISMASAAKHPFIADAFARMQIDQFATEEQVVFDQNYLSQCGLEMLEIVHPRSAQNWRHQNAASFRDSPRMMDRSNDSSSTTSLYDGTSWFLPVRIHEAGDFSQPSCDNNNSRKTKALISTSAPIRYAIWCIMPPNECLSR